MLVRGFPAEEDAGKPRTMRVAATPAAGEFT